MKTRLLRKRLNKTANATKPVLVEGRLPIFHVVMDRHKLGLTPNYLREIEERIIWRLQTEFKDKNDLVQQIVADNFESLHNCLAVSGWQEVANIKKLKRGDIVRNKNSQNSYVVSANYGDRVTAICSVDITNAQEWEVLKSWAIKNEG